MNTKISKLMLLPLAMVSSPLCTVSCANRNNDDPIANEIYTEALLEFAKLCEIPHCSNEEGHLDSLIDITNEVKRVAMLSIPEDQIFIDKIGNIWYDIPATAGCQDYQSIILQSHLDMVGVSTDKSWDKWTDPVAQPVIENINGQEVMHALKYKTNLGIDDGNGIALMLSLTLNRDIFNHGKIRCIYTVNEENSMPGVEELGIMNDGSRINVIDGFNYLINLDGNPVGDVVFNSAGGFGPIWNVKGLDTEIISGYEYEIHIKNCHGGHSGLNINDHLVNPIKLIADCILDNFEDESNIYIISFTSGSEDTKTSIQKEAVIKFIYKTTSTPKTPDELKQWLKNEIITSYPGETYSDNLTSVTQHSVQDACCINAGQSRLILSLIHDIKYGAELYNVHDEEKDAIKWSSNIGLINVNAEEAEPKLTFYAAVRFQEMCWLSEPMGIYNTLFGRYIEDFTNIGANPDPYEITEESVSKPWEGSKNSNLCNLCIKTYNSLGIKSKKKRIHGGLECTGFLSYKNDLVQVSVGPTNDAEHSVQENLYLDSYKKITAMIVRVLMSMKDI